VLPSPQSSGSPAANLVPSAHRFRPVCSQSKRIIAELETDCDRHIKRVIGYARPSDYAVGAATAAAGPGLMLLWERVSPSLVGKGGFAPIMRLSGVIGLGAGFLTFYQRSIRAFLDLPLPGVG
jgi:hypothetical protein